VPKANEGASIREALVPMSKAGLGFVNVVNDQDAVTGVFTDGDLRRVLDRDVDIKRVKLSTVMAREFVKIHVNQLAAQAVDLMDKHKVSAMPVVDDEARLVGAVNMRMLLQAGVV